MAQSRILLASALMVMLGTSAFAQSGANVLVVANGQDQGSIRIAEHYQRARAVPDTQIIKLTGLALAPADDIDRRDFEQAIQAPIERWLIANAAQDRIHYIVLTKGIPLRVKGSGGRRGTVASVDSELTMLYRRMTGGGLPPAGPIPNPYFLGDAPVTAARPFTHETSDLFLVTRLDGFTVDDALALVDRSVRAAPTPSGRILLDERGSWLAKGNEWLRTAAARLTQGGLEGRVVLDQTSQVLGNQTDVLGYYSWGSNDPAIRVRRFGLTFEPGALAAMFVSTDGRTFREPPDSWKLGDWSDKATFFAGTPQSLTGDLIREGVTGTAGHVAEPFLDATIRPDVLFPAYLAGRSLAESFYLAMPYLSWQTVVLGDPLCTPFREASFRALSLDASVDPSTELPTWFSERKVRNLTTGGTASEAVRLLIRSENRQFKGDRPGAIADLERAIVVDGRYKAALERLSIFYEADGAHDKAAGLYRRLLEIDGNSVVVLNNLAWHLAVREKRPSDALPLAQRARTLQPKSAAVADTLGWVYFLLGDAQGALPLVLAASNATPADGGMKGHLAAILAAVGRSDEARQALAEALSINPSLADEEYVKDVRARLR